MNPQEDRILGPPTEEDRDPGNVMLRAGYLAGLAMRLEASGDKKTDNDSVMLYRAARSLLAYAEILYRARDPEQQ